jgi:hypothetical protein
MAGQKRLACGFINLFTSVETMRWMIWVTTIISIEGDSLLLKGCWRLEANTSKYTNNPADNQPDYWVGLCWEP